MYRSQNLSESAVDGFSLPLCRGARFLGICKLGIAVTISQAIPITRATKRKMNQDALFDEDGQPLACPACCSEEVEAISDYDRNYALGMFQIYGFIGHLPTVTHSFRCLHCGYEW